MQQSSWYSWYSGFVHGSLIPNVHSVDGTARKSVGIMDNCTIHHVINARGIMLLLYSPDTN